MKIRIQALGIALVCLPALAFSQPIRVASWNLGWHVSLQEVPNWIDKCGRSFRKNPNTKRWDLAGDNAGESKIGWYIQEDRATLEGVDLSVMPPCGVYREYGKGIAVTLSSYANRERQLSKLMQEAIKPDVIAFQEVSGTAAVQEALGSSADQYNICSFDGQFKVQRLAFAWRKKLGEAAEACQAIGPVSLPQLPFDNQVRPALTVGLRLGGKLVRFMNVHLKSACFSSLKDENQKQEKLDDESAAACAVLQKQIRPLEAAVETLVSGAAHFVVLGDFNRNLWHELHEVKDAEAVRSNGERDLRKSMPAGILSRNLFKEVFDGEPGGPVVLLPLKCTEDPANQALCEASKVRLLTKKEAGVLAAPAALGCRNSIGLDHFVISASLQPKVISAEKLSIGPFGASKSPKEGKPEPLLAVSDHCPIVMTLNL